MAVQLLNQADDKVTIACAIDKNIVIMKWRFKYRAAFLPITDFCIIVKHITSKDYIEEIHIMIWSDIMYM